MIKKNIKKITFTGIMLALAIILSTFCQIKLYSDIKLDLSYIIITVICYTYGALTGCIFAGSIALFNSTFFSSYGTSPSWIIANMFIGLICGLILHNFKPNKKVLKISIDTISIVITCTIALIIFKTLIECKLYEIPFSIKVIKNSIAFISDTALMLIGYFTLIPLYNKITNKQNTNYNNFKIRGGYRL